MIEELSEQPLTSLPDDICGHLTPWLNQESELFEFWMKGYAPKFRLAVEEIKESYNAEILKFDDLTVGEPPKPVDHADGSISRTQPENLDRYVHAGVIGGRPKLHYFASFQDPTYESQSSHSPNSSNRSSRAELPETRESKSKVAPDSPLWREAHILLRAQDIDGQIQRRFKILDSGYDHKASSLFTLSDVERLVQLGFEMGFLYRDIWWQETHGTKA